VHFIIRHEAKQTLRFAALQSAAGRTLLGSSDWPVKKGQDVDNIGSFIIVDMNGKAHSQFTACLIMFESMGGIWRIFGRGCGLVIPRSLGDFFYRLGWNYRYLIMGKAETCLKPTPQLVERLVKGGDDFE